MPILTIPKSLEEKLGPEATVGLIEVLNEVEKIAKEDVILLAEQKYERRLSEETSKLDKRITDEVAKLDRRIVEEVSKVKVDIIKWMVVLFITQIGVLTAIMSFVLK